MRALRNTAYVCAFFAYVLIVFGAFVRITGSGLGCGDQWPLCNGRIIPPLDDVAVIIEYGHRLAAVGLSVLVVVLIGLAIAQRRQPGGSGAGGTFAPAMVATALLVVQILLGAVTVWLDLAAAAVVLHLATAMAFLAALLITGLRAGARAGHPAQSAGASTRRSAHVAAGLGAAAILLGGLTATSGAGPLCLGFPLCNGQVWPSGPGLVHIHWTHRLVAYALFFHALGLAMAARRKSSTAADPGGGMGGVRGSRAPDRGGRSHDTESLPASVARPACCSRHGVVGSARIPRLASAEGGNPPADRICRAGPLRVLGTARRVGGDEHARSNRSRTH